MSAIKTERLAVISLRARNVPLSVHFYRDVLGLDLLLHHDHRPAFDLGGGTYLVILKGTPVPPQNAEPARFPLLAFAVRDLDAAFPKDVLIVEASDGTCYRFDVYLALDDPHRARGLMFVRDLPATTGMLFVYRRDDILTFWMKNTYLSLDMVFARRDGTVSSVVRDAEPLSLKTIASTEPVAMVLELNAGTAHKLRIDEHSRLLWDPAHDE